MNRSSGMRRLSLWGPVAAYVALIFYLSGLSDLRLAALYPDHLLHAAEFFGLAILVARALNRGLLRPMTSRSLFLAFVLCALYAVSDEIHQMYVPNRFSELSDVLSDLAGAALGLVGLLLMQRTVLRRHLA